MGQAGGRRRWGRNLTEGERRGGEESKWGEGKGRGGAEGRSVGMQRLRVGASRVELGMQCQGAGSLRDAKEGKGSRGG